MGEWQGEEERRLGRFAGLLRCWSAAGGTHCCCCSVDNPSGTRCCSGFVGNPSCAARTPAAAWTGDNFKSEKFNFEIVASRFVAAAEEEGREPRRDHREERKAGNGSFE